MHDEVNPDDQTPSRRIAKRWLFRMETWRWLAIASILLVSVGVVCLIFGDKDGLYPSLDFVIGEPESNVRFKLGDPKTVHSVIQTRREIVAQDDGPPKTQKMEYTVKVLDYRRDNIRYWVGIYDGEIVVIQLALLGEKPHPQKLNGVAFGITFEQVLAKVGKPSHRHEADGGRRRLLIYEDSKPRCFYILDTDKVIAFGTLGIPQNGGHPFFDLEQVD